MSQGFKWVLLSITGAVCIAGCGASNDGEAEGSAGTQALATAGSGAGIGSGTSGGTAGTTNVGTAGSGTAGDGQNGTAGDGTNAADGGSSGSGAAGTGGGEPGTDCGLGMAAPANGFQVCSKGIEINANTDIEYCEVVTLPGDASDTYYVNRVETQMTNHSHHLIILAADPGSSNEANMPDGKRVGCVGGEQAFGQGLSHVTGSQRPYGDAAFPAGVGKVYHGGQRLSFDYHYFNTTDAPVMARAALNMHLVEKDAVQHIARQFGFYNYAIFIQQGQSAGFDMTCTAPADIMVHSITRHTHKWGTDFTVWAEGGSNDGSMLWKSTDYEGDTTYVLPSAPTLVKAGEGFKFRCDFDNTSDHTLTFGVKATNEMCILFGTWWKVNESDSVGTGSMSCKFPQ